MNGYAVAIDGQVGLPVFETENEAKERADAIAARSLAEDQCLSCSLEVVAVVVTLCRRH